MGEIMDSTETGSTDFSPFFSVFLFPFEQSDWFLSLILRATGQKADNKGRTDHAGQNQGHLSMFPTTADTLEPVLYLTRAV